MFAFANVMDFFTNEFTSLGRRGLTGTLIPPSAFDRFLLGHVRNSF
jgi:hypothetical protein